MQSIDLTENKKVPNLKRLFGTQCHHVYFVEFYVKCKLHFKDPHIPSKMYAAISEDSEDNQVNFISISTR